jgi:hypothetical protein
MAMPMAVITSLAQIWAIPQSMLSSTYITPPWYGGTISKILLSTPDTQRINNWPLL